MKYDNDIIQQIKDNKQKAVNQLLEDCRVFFAFSNEQLKEGLDKYPLAKGDKLVSMGAGGYLPKSKVQDYLKGSDQIEKDYKKAIKDNKQRKANILYELRNREAFYTGDLEDTLEALGEGYTYEEVKQVYNENRKNNELE